MSFDRKKSLRRLLTVVAILGTSTVISACQVRPLYGTTTLTAQHMASVSFSNANSRVEQVVRNQLIFLTSGGAGEAEKPEYSVTFSAGSSVNKVLLIDSSDTARAAQVTVSGSYKLVRNSDQQVLKSGNRSATAIMDYSIQEFANVRAIRDAEDRAAKELAELIRADLAIALSR